MNNSKNQKIQQQQFFDEIMMYKKARERLPKSLDEIAVFYETQFAKDLAHFFNGESIRSILDVGCGDGMCSILMARKNKNARVVGIDISLQSLREAQTKISPDIRQRIEFVLCDCENLPFRSDSFDAAILVDILHHVPSLYLLQEVQKVVKEDGRCIINDCVVNNLLMVLLMKVYLFVPKTFKMRMFEYGFIEKSDTSAGGPKFTDRALKHSLLHKSNFSIIKEDRQSLFLFIFFYLSLIPLINRILSSSVLFSINRIERFLIEHTPLRNFCYIVLYFCIKNMKNERSDGQ